MPAQFSAVPQGLRRLTDRVAAASARAGRLPDRGSRRAFAVALRATIMVGALSGMAIWASIPGNLIPQDGVRFTEGTPTAQISPAGSVSQRPRSTPSDAQASRSGSTTPAQALPTSVPTSTELRSAPCHVSYSMVSDATSRFTLVIVIANTSAKKVNGWTLNWDFPAKQKILYGWNTLVTNGQDGIIAADIGTNQVIAPGESVTIGFVGTRGAWVPTPTGFTLNGQACHWQPAVALITPSTPTPTSTPSTTAPPTVIPRSPTSGDDPWVSAPIDATSLTPQG